MSAWPRRRKTVKPPSVQERAAGYRPTTPVAATTPKPAAVSIKPRDPEKLTGLAVWIRQNQPSPQRIIEQQKRIHHEMLSLSRTIDRPNFQKVGRDDLVRLIHLMDDAFFGSRVLPIAKAEGLNFKFSSRMTSAAGKLVTHYPNGSKDAPRKFELILSSTLLFQTFEDVDRPVLVTGRRCVDRLEAMQRVAEHEMTHLIEMMIWNDGNCSQSRFQSIAKSFFGHTDYQHDLITQRERAATKFNIRIGDRVYFESQNGRVFGKVNRITRRATVLVEDSKGQRFSDGKRYSKWYVPLEKLKLA